MGNNVAITVTGAGGRMGRSLIEAVNEESAATLSSAVERPGSPYLGVDAGEISGIGSVGTTIVDDLVDATGRSDVLVDFTRPEVKT